MTRQEDLRSMFNAVYLDDAPAVTYNRFHKLMDDALAEARAEGECEAQTEVVKGYHEYGWSHKDTVVWAIRRIEELKRGSK